MKIIHKDFEYEKDIDVLCRVYPNQDPNNTNEKEQVCADVLFKAHLKREHKRATAWLPRGAVAFIVQELNKLGKNSYKVQISNELTDNVGVLTYCRDNFKQSMEWEKLKKN